MSRNTIAQLRNDLGLALWDAGRVHESIVELRKAIGEDPDLTDAQFNLGRILTATHGHGEAITILQRVVEANPKHIPAREQLVCCLMAIGDYDGATAQRLAVLELNQPDPSIRQFMQEHPIVMELKDRC